MSTSRFISTYRRPMMLAILAVACAQQLFLAPSTVFAEDWSTALQHGALLPRAADLRSAAVLSSETGLNAATELVSASAAWVDTVADQLQPHPAATITASTVIAPERLSLVVAALGFLTLACHLGERMRLATLRLTIA